MISTDELFRRYAARQAKAGKPLIPNRDFDHENKIIQEENTKANSYPKDRIRRRLKASLLRDNNEY